MRKSTLLLAGLIGFSSWALTTEPETIQLPANFDAWNLNYKLPLEKLPAPGNTVTAKAAKPGMMKAIKKEAASTEYFVAAQSFHSNYTFIFNGGDIKTYNIGIAVDGDQVTISRLFNLEAQSTDWAKGVDYDIVGTYDAEAKTITIPTPTDFNNATIAGTVGDYYTEVLACGEVTEDGTMAPTDELVLNVIGDFEAIETDMSFGIMNYTNDGSSCYGTQTLYRRFYAQIPDDEPKLICYNETIDLGETFSGVPAESKFSVVNVCGVDVDYMTDVESDGDSFSVSPDGGLITSGSVQEFNVKFLPTEEGDFEGMVTIEYDGAEETPEPIAVLFTASAIPTPDYSGAVKSGDFKFQTNIEYPFEMTTLEDGTAVARSTVNGQYGSSKLNVEFEVPEGNIGVFAWKGETVNTGQWYQNAGGYFIDNAETPAASFTDTRDISGNIEFGPGKHSVRFQYDGSYYTGDEKNGLYVYDLELASAPAKADSVVVETPDIKLNNLMIKDENGVEAQGMVILRSKGLNPLSVTGITSSDEHFTANVPSSQAGLLETVEIPVIFRTAEPGEYNAELTIATTAGEVKANVNVLVRKMADFSTVVAEGSEYVTGFSTDDSFPFEVENGVAYNANSGEADDAATTSWFMINYTIPEGKAGYLTWDGESFPDMPDPENYWIGDYAGIEMTHPMNSGTKPVYPNETDASSNTFANDPSWEHLLTAVPGNHSIKFLHYKNGDGSISERDRVEFSNFRIKVVDFKEHDVEADVTEINFEEPIYVGPNRYSTAVVTLKNTGSQPLEILDCIADEPFYGVMPENPYPVQWNGTIQVGIWFYPSEEGEFEGTVTFNTNAGDVNVHCTGSTKEAEGILLIGDVENQGDGWSFYDADKDGLCWNLGYNLWGQNEDWVHEGLECFGSVSYDPYSGGIEPDNWLLSPTVGIPEDGAMLRWYAASHHHERYAENYSVYVTTPEMISDPANLADLEPVFTETLTPESTDEWQERIIDLSEYAEEDIVVVFRHHDCNGQYVLKIDDVFVYDMEKWNAMQSGINKVAASADVVSTEIFDINGIRSNSLKKGINIVRSTLSDGSVKTSKIIVK